MTIYNEWVKLDSKDDKPLYRTKDDILNSRKTKDDKLNWYKYRGYKASINVPTTPNSKLKMSIMKRLDREGLSEEHKVIIQEDGGRSIRSSLSTLRNTNTPPTCNRPKCLPCVSFPTSPATTSSNCWAKRPTYNISCLSCKASGQTTQYWGESGHTLYTRAKIIGMAWSNAASQASSTSMLFSTMAGPTTN